MGCFDWGIDLCTGGTPSTNCSFDIFIIDRAFDDDTGTYWLASGCGATVPYAQYWKAAGIWASKCRAYNISGSSGLSLTLHGSNTGISFSDALCTLTPNAGWQEHEFAPAEYKWWRWIASGAPGDNSLIVAELELYACKAAINIGDAWKNIEEVQINIGDVWKDITDIDINIGDTWKTIL